MSLGQAFVYYVDVFSGGLIDPGTFGAFAQDS